MSEQKTKNCTQCGEMKPLTDYYRGGKCKECIKANQRERNKKTKELENEIKTKPELRDKPKICSVCNKTKTVGDFRVNRAGCIDCERSYGRDYNQENPEIRKQWHDDNKKHFAKLNADNYQRNKPKIRETYNDKYYTDDNFRYRKDCRDKLLWMVKKIKNGKYCGKKYETTMKLLEYNFIGEMCWDNHGTCWDIDHIIPITKWDLNDEEQRNMCFNWKNLMPLECDVNRNKKRDKILDEQTEKQRKRLKSFFEENEFDDDKRKKYIKKVKQLFLTSKTP